METITLSKPGKDPKLPQNLRPISLVSTTGKLFEKFIQQIVQRHLSAKKLLNVSRFGFHARHSTTLQCMRLTHHITLNFDNNISTATVFLDTEKAFDTTWRPGLLYKLSKLHFLVDLIRLTNSYLSDRKFKVSVEGELSMPREKKQGCHKVPSWHQFYIACISMTAPPPNPRGQLGTLRG
jgi:hypothetical protein